MSLLVFARLFLFDVASSPWFAVVDLLPGIVLIGGVLGWPGR